MKNSENYNKILNKCKLSITKLDANTFNGKTNIDISDCDYFTFFAKKAFDASKFDVEYYKEHYLSDIDDCDPISHYLDIGVKKGFNPNAFFDSVWYLNEYPDVKNANVNPFIHYAEHGIYEGRIPKILTWEEFYKEFKNLKLTLKGRKKYLFLVNDSSYEILQHFDENYKNLFNPKIFSDDLHYKKKMFSKNNIDYYFFSVPDKSVVCKDLLPFEYNVMKRNVDLIDNIIDFAESLLPIHYFKYDSHMNFEGGKLLTFKILNYLNNDFSSEDYENLLSDKEEKYFYRKFDLFEPLNWSYSNLEKILFPKEQREKQPVPKYLKDLSEDIPHEFSFVHARKSIHLKNDNSYSNLRVLIFRDSSFDYLQTYLSFYFREMFIYWDHGNFNKKLIEWYKPDLILEIRIERFIDSLPRAPWIENREELNIVD